jgi:hypothetical protein
MISLPIIHSGQVGQTIAFRGLPTSLKRDRLTPYTYTRRTRALMQQRML